jgi:hypothetical protein
MLLTTCIILLFVFVLLGMDIAFPSGLPRNSMPARSTRSCSCVQ